MSDSVGDDDSSLPFATVNERSFFTENQRASCRIGQHSHATERAFICATCAEDAFLQGDLESAASNHIQAAKAFIEAAETLNDTETVTVLLFLSQAHARQASDFRKYEPFKLDNSKNELGSEKRTLRVSSSGLTRMKSDPVVSNLDDSIMSSRILPRQEVHTNIQSCVQDMLELERRLLTLGIGSNTRHRIAQPPPPSTRYLASTLGESFCLLNQSVGSNLLVESVSGAEHFNRAPLMGNIQLQSKYSSPVFEKREDSFPINRGALTSDHNTRKKKIQNLDCLDASEFEIKPSTSCSDRHRSDSSQSQSEIMRLLNCMRILSEENAQLMRECEEGRKEILAATNASKDVMEFKQEYTHRFKLLRKALGEFKQRYPSMHSAIDPSIQGVDSTPRLQELEGQVESLSLKVRQLTDSARRKDSMLERYEKWYKTLKANARSKPKIEVGNPGVPPRPLRQQSDIVVSEIEENMVEKPLIRGPLNMGTASQLCPLPQL